MIMYALQYNSELLVLFAVLDFTNYIKSLSPSALDMELRMLEIIDEDIEEELIKRPEFISIGQLLDYFINEISCRNDFEFTQAVVKLFLKVNEISFPMVTVSLQITDTVFGFRILTPNKTRFIR